MKNYLSQSQSSKAKSTHRIHIYTPKAVEANKEQYREYIQLMDDAGFNALRFIEEYPSLEYLKKGSGLVVFDDEVCFEAYSDNRKNAHRANGQLMVSACIFNKHQQDAEKLWDHPKTLSKEEVMRLLNAGSEDDAPIPFVNSSLK